MIHNSLCFSNNSVCEKNNNNKSLLWWVAALNTSIRLFYTNITLLFVVRCYEQFTGYRAHYKVFT